MVKALHAVAVPPAVAVAKNHPVSPSGEPATHSHSPHLHLARPVTECAARHRIQMSSQRVHFLARSKVDYANHAALAVRIAQVVLLATPHSRLLPSPIPKHARLQHHIAPRGNPFDDRVLCGECCGVHHANRVELSRAGDNGAPVGGVLTSRDGRVMWGQGIHSPLQGYTPATPRLPAFYA